jgi:hypothetical protein
MLCTDWDGHDRLHTFLNKYDLVNILRGNSTNQNTVSSPIRSSQVKPKGRISMKLYAAEKSQSDFLFSDSASASSDSMVQSIFKIAQDRVDASKSKLLLSRDWITDDVLMIARKERLKLGIEALSEGLIEREEESRLVLFATLCGEHLLLLGPPGTSNSKYI